MTRATRDDAERLRIAGRVLEALDAEHARLDASRPPLGDAAAMERRQQRRAELARWAAGPRATREELLAATRAQVVGRIRALSRR